MTTRVGKIARLPLSIKEELNQRLLDGQMAGKILPWLNGLPEVKAVLEEDFEGLAVNDQNLSDWRKGGYQDWLRRRDGIERTREMAQWSIKLAKAGGGNLTEGAAAILSGQILSVLEGLDECLRTATNEAETSEQARARLAEMQEAIDGLTLAVARLRKGDQNAEQLRLMRERLQQTADALVLEQQKFQRQTCELFLKWHQNQQANQIAAGSGSNGEKIEALGKLIFKDLWK